MYADFCRDYLASPVIVGQKSESEKFAGAMHTYSIEGLMQDGKALQSGTSHHLGQNFAKGFNVKFSNKDGQLEYVWQTSWGVSTRLMGQLIMTHSDDNGLVLPPKIAPIKIVILPIWKDENSKNKVMEFAEKLYSDLNDSIGDTELDIRDYLSLGEKSFEWEKKGVPIRVEIGPRDLDSNSVVLVRRDKLEKSSVNIDDLKSSIINLLNDIQENLLMKASEFVSNNSHFIDDYDQFKKQLDKDIPGFIYSFWCGAKDCEEKIKDETKATTRCIPFDQKEEIGKCIKCGGKSNKRIIFAKAY